jgi:diacylglycerol kinase family enzyme
MMIQPENQMKKEEDGYEPVFSNEALAHFDFEQLARKGAYQEKCDQTPIEEDVQEKKPFFDVPDLWPFSGLSEEGRAQMQGVDWMNLDR